MTRRAFIKGKVVKFCIGTPKDRFMNRVFPPVEFATRKRAERAKLMFETRIREFPDWLIAATKPRMPA